MSAEGDMAFRRVGELEVDGRRRISLGRIGRREDTRYIAEEGPDGEIRLIPARTIPAREAIVWENPAVLDALRQGMEEAVLGKLEGRGSFAAFLTESDGETTQYPRRGSRSKAPAADEAAASARVLGSSSKATRRPRAKTVAKRSKS